MSVSWSGGSGATSLNAQIYKSALSNMTSFSTVTATPASSTSVTSPTSFALSTFAAASYYYYGAIITAINASGSTPSSMSTGVRYIPTFTASSLAGAPTNSLVTTNGTGAAASFNNLQAVVCDSTTNIYITENNLYYLSLHLKLSSLFYSTQLIDIFSYELPTNNNIEKKKTMPLINNSLLVYHTKYYLNIHTIITHI
jgi:hypothetical protein